MTRSGANRLVETIERTRLTWPMAVLMAGAAAFLVYAVPAAIVERAVAMTGIGGLAAVTVPFGAVARGVLALVAAVLSGGAVWALFDRLDGGWQVVEADADPDIDLFAPEIASAPAPQLRRADAHPDAPPRRPIFAASDLGAPMADPESRQTPFGRAPLFTDDSGQPAATESTDPQEDEPDTLLLDARYGMAADASDDAVDAKPAATADLVPAPIAGESIAGLMARLERGLERRGGPAAVALSLGDPDALRQALDELRHMTIGR